jgi:hypothetical protein
MTQSIDRDTQGRALVAPESDTVPEGRLALIVGIRIFAGLAALTGVGLTVADLTGGDGAHLIAASCTSFILAGLAGAILSVDAILADRQEFYRRGELTGWIRGWRGQEPEVSDPLLRG